MTFYIHEYNNRYYGSNLKYPCATAYLNLESIRYFDGKTLVRMGPKYYDTPGQARAGIEAAGFQAEDNYIF
jgi:hypothetical protein